MNNLLIAENISLIRQNRLLFRRLNLTIHGGEGIHLQGDNGSGKTSLLQILAGILSPTQGTINRQSEVIYLGHQAGIKSLFTVRENLLLFAQLYHGLNKSEAIQHIEKAINYVGLEKFSNIKAQFLSAGQKRRVQLARLWLPTPKIWLLDEPLNALDQETVHLLIQHCINHIQNKGALMITSHQDLVANSTSIKSIQIDSLFH